MNTYVKICFEMRDAGECERFFAYLRERPRAMWDYEERVREKFHEAGLAADFHAHWTDADVVRTDVRSAAGVIAYEATLRAGAKDPSLLVDVLRRCGGVQDGSIGGRWTIGAWYRRGEHGEWTADTGNASKHADADGFCTGVQPADRAHCGCMTLSACAALAARIVGRWRLCGEAYRRYRACEADPSTANKAALCWALWETLTASEADAEAAGAGMRVVVLTIRVDKHAAGGSREATGFDAEAERGAMAADLQRFVAMYREYSSRGGVETLLDRLTAFV